MGNLPLVLPSDRSEGKGVLHEVRQEEPPMPRATFKPLSTANLARCFVAVLAMDQDDRETIIRGLHGTVLGNRVMQQAHGFNLAKLFDSILSAPKEKREFFANEFNRLLDELTISDAIRREDDPRGYGAD